VQLSLPLSGPAPLATDRIVFVRHRRARRYILRVLTDGTVRVTLPRWGIKRDAQAFVDASREWIEQRRASLSRLARPAQHWQDGTSILIDGAASIIRVELATSGYRVFINGSIVAEKLLHLREVRPSVEVMLRARAARELPPALLALARAHGITVPRVSVRNQRSRWGACSPAGMITLNWRLIQVPPFVREYVLVHELMHRRELNHSRRFWKLVSSACSELARARAWLKTEGKELWPDAD